MKATWRNEREDLCIGALPIEQNPKTTISAIKRFRTTNMAKANLANLIVQRRPKGPNERHDHRVCQKPRPSTLVNNAGGYL